MLDYIRFLVIHFLFYYYFYYILDLLFLLFLYNYFFFKTGAMTYGPSFMKLRLAIARPLTHCNLILESTESPIDW
jgi:hypothetical protein